VSLRVELKGEGGQVIVEVHGYENPDAQDVSDANWLNCVVSADVAGFTASFPTSFTTHDFKQFREELSRVYSELKGKASFLTDEDAFRMTIDVASTGRVSVSGVLQTFGSPNVSMKFSFLSDQSNLATTNRALEAILAEFPVKSE
jgi:hypothetical protein